MISLRYNKSKSIADVREEKKNSQTRIHYRRESPKPRGVQDHSNLRVSSLHTLYTHTRPQRTSKTKHQTNTRASREILSTKGRRPKYETSERTRGGGEEERNKRKNSCQVSKALKGEKGVSFGLSHFRPRVFFFVLLFSLHTQVGRASADRRTIQWYCVYTLL